jgi:uncharacterized membrane protein
LKRVDELFSSGPVKTVPETQKEKTTMIDIAHIHPMLIHFPLALVPVALAAQFFAVLKGESLFGRHCLATTALALIVLAAIGAVIAAVFGDMALDQAIANGVPETSLETHQELGQLSAMLMFGLAVIEVWLYSKTKTGAVFSWGFLLAGAGVLVVLLSTAWFGGQLVYELGVNVLHAA